MKYCNKLFTEINFEPTAVLPCCDVMGIGVPEFPFAGEKFDCDAYEEHVHKTHKALQQGSPLCSGCPHLTEVEEFSPTFALRTVSLNHYRYLCNCRCVYCSLWHNLKQSYPVMHVIQKLYAEKRLHHPAYFAWGGGEPSITPEFEELCRFIQQQQAFQEINTNAIVFSEAMADLLRHGAGRIRTSLDSGSAEIYKAVKGVDRFDRVATNIKKYLKAAENPANVVVKYILFELNNSHREIDRFFAVCATLGVRNVELSLNFHEISKHTVSDTTKHACVYFAEQAESLGLQCDLFYLAEYLDALQKE